MPEPTLVVISGPPGSGKTRIAHAIAEAIPCPAICRDEIKEGMAHAEGSDFQPAQGDPLTLRTLTTFFETLRLLLTNGVSVVAEAAFQDQRWRPGLESQRSSRSSASSTAAWMLPLPGKGRLNALRPERLMPSART